LSGRNAEAAPADAGDQMGVNNPADEAFVNATAEGTAPSQHIFQDGAELMLESTFAQRKRREKLDHEEKIRAAGEAPHERYETTVDVLGVDDVHERLETNVSLYDLPCEQLVIDPDTDRRKWVCMYFGNPQVNARIDHWLAKESMCVTIAIDEATLTVCDKSNRRVTPVDVGRNADAAGVSVSVTCDGESDDDKCVSSTVTMTYGDGQLHLAMLAFLTIMSRDKFRRMNKYTLQINDTEKTYKMRALTDDQKIAILSSGVKYTRNDILRKAFAQNASLEQAEEVTVEDIVTEMIKEQKAVFEELKKKIDAQTSEVTWEQQRAKALAMALQRKKDESIAELAKPNADLDVVDAQESGIQNMAIAVETQVDSVNESKKDLDESTAESDACSKLIEDLSKPVSRTAFIKKCKAPGGKLTKADLYKHFKDCGMTPPQNQGETLKAPMRKKMCDSIVLKWIDMDGQAIHDQMLNQTNTSHLDGDDEFAKRMTLNGKTFIVRFEPSVVKYKGPVTTFQYKDTENDGPETLKVRTGTIYEDDATLVNEAEYTE
jgi:hypothetical protein